MGQSHGKTVTASFFLMKEIWIGIIEAGVRSVISLFDFLEGMMFVISSFLKNEKSFFLNCKTELLPLRNFLKVMSSPLITQNLGYK